MDALGNPQSIQSEIFVPVPGGIFPGTGKISQTLIFLENLRMLNLDAMSVPETLVHSIRILEAPAVYLKHRWLKSGIPENYLELDALGYSPRNGQDAGRAPKKAWTPISTMQAFGVQRNACSGF